MEEHPNKSVPVVQDDFSGQASVVDKKPNCREVCFILDHSAFTLGLGNIKRWFDKKSFQSRVADKNEMVHLNIYIPINTLHELNLKKSVPTIASTRSREALAFIDEMLEKEEDINFGELTLGSEAEKYIPTESVSEPAEIPAPTASTNDTDNTAHEGKPNSKGQTKQKSRRSRHKAKKSLPKGAFSYNLILEDRSHGFLPWNTCMKHQLRKPLNREFPAYKNMANSRGYYGNEAQEYDELEDEANIPTSITFLIRSCVSIRRSSAHRKPATSKEQWILVTEDAASKIWAHSFGMDSLNINEAELLLFQGKDLGSSEVKAPGADFFSETDVYDPVSSPLHKVVNTASYDYSNLKDEESKKATKGKGERVKKRTSKNTRKKDQTAAVSKEENGVILEDFEMINYAPRDSGSGLIRSNLMVGSKRGKKTHGEKS